MTYNRKHKNFIFILLGLILISFFFSSINFISASSVVIYDDPSVPHATISSTEGTTNINNTYTNITNNYNSINQTNNYTNNESLWNLTTNIAGAVTIHPANLTPNVGIGTNNSAYDLEVRNLDGQNTYLGISSPSGNDNASLVFREADVVRYQIFYDGLISMFQIYSFAIDKTVLSFNTNGDAEFSQDVNILGNLTAPNICYSNGSNCNITVGVNGENGTNGINGTFATFVGLTSAAYTGNVTNGTLKGYSAVNNICNLTFIGSHLCEYSEIKGSINSGISLGATTFWFSNGPPGYTANANDCLGFTSSSGSYLGAFWDPTSTTDVYGSGWLTACSGTKKLGCCK